MKVTRSVEVPAQPAHFVTKVVGVACDLCGKDVGMHLLNDFQRDDVKVKRRHGTSYPGSGDLTTEEFDLCGPCFTTKLVPWMQAQGAVLQTTEVDW